MAVYSREAGGGLPCRASQKAPAGSVPTQTDIFLHSSEAVELTLKINHTQPTRAAEVSSCFTDLSLLATSPPSLAAFGSPREAQGRGRSSAEHAGTGRLHRELFGHAATQPSHPCGEEPPLHSILPLLVSEMLPAPPG